MKKTRRLIKEEMYFVIHFITSICGEYLQQDTCCLEDTTSVKCLR